MESTRKKNLLIAIRDSTSSSQGVRFAGSFFKNHADLIITLFYVIQKPLSEHLRIDPWADDLAASVALPQDVEKTFSLCSKVLRQKGFPENQIQKISRRKQSGTVSDIISEGRHGLYDAVLLGKRSTSFLENILNGNKGHEVMEKELSSPVWFCRDPDENRRNVLLCLDGSAIGEKIADHVGYILQDEEHHCVTLFYVDKGQDVDQEIIFAEATDVLKSYGLPAERIKKLTVKALRVTRAILDQAEQGKFAAIAIGSVGRTVNKGIYEQLIGSKCKNIFDQIDKATLWIVP